LYRTTHYQGGVWVPGATVELGNVTIFISMSL
jgi:hypothetical protein